MSLFKRKGKGLGAGFNDEVTGVGTRRRLDRDLQRSPKLEGALMAVMMVEIDHFVRFTDLHGHAEADDVLKRVADVLREAVRGGDDVYRYADNQFCILLADTTVSEAQLVAERIRFAVFCIDLSMGDSITVSIGVATVPAPELETAVRRADDALESSRRGGHDRVTVVTSDRSSSANRRHRHRREKVTVG